MNEPPEGLVGADNLLVALFPNEQDRPTKRWLEKRCRDGTIPYIKLGRLVWFSVPQVTKAMQAYTMRGRKRYQL